MNVKESIILVMSLVLSFAGYAQDYDDVYFDYTKSKKVEKNKKNTEDFVDYNADGSMRDVDEYNRRYTVGEYVVDSLNGEQGEFVYTDRIKRFYNPQVVAESNNPQIIERYYTITSPEVNIIIDNPYYWNSPYWYDWYTPSYYWRYGVYGPRWYDSWYGWNWGFGWDWCYYDHYHHHHHHHPTYYPGGFYPHTPSGGGGNVAHRPSYNGGGRRPFGVSTGNNSNVGRRPSDSDRGRNNSTVKNNSNRRPKVSNSSSSSRRSSSMSSSSSRRSNYSNSGSSSNYNHSSSRGRGDGNSSGSSYSSGGGGGSRSSGGGSGRSGRR